MKNATAMPKRLVAERTTRKEQPAAPSSARGEFPNVTEQVAMEIADLLCNGGHEDDLAGLAVLAIRHHGRRVFDNQAFVDQFADKWENKWISELIDATAAVKSRSNAARPKTNSIAERIRHSVIGEASEKFHEFLHEARPEEVWFMREVLTSRGSAPTPERGMPAGDDTIPIAWAFDATIGEEGLAYFKVPARMVASVQAYIDCLRTAEVSDDNRKRLSE
jgi:hypothetical protein